MYKKAPEKPEGEIIQEGQCIYATMKLGDKEVRERLPLVIKKWPEERASEYLEAVTIRLKRKLGIVTTQEDQVTWKPKQGPSRRQRRAQMAAMRIGIKRRRRVG